MIYNIEYILKIVFLVLSILWASNIMILRTDKQIVINPILILIGSILVFFGDLNDNYKVFGIDFINIKIALYVIYILIILFGLYTTKKTGSIF